MSGDGQGQDLLGSGLHTSGCGAPEFLRVRCRMGRGGWVNFTKDRTRCSDSTNCGLFGSDYWSEAYKPENRRWIEEMDKAQKGSAFAWVEKENVSLWTAVSPQTVRVHNASHANVFVSLHDPVRISADLLV
jgi:hypothetical protein